jgi:hypothetical protein
LQNSRLFLIEKGGFWRQIDFCHYSGILNCRIRRSENS